MKTGKLIIIEGIDGSGKDTQADLLVEQFGCIKTRLPLYDYETGKLLRSHIDSQKEGVSEEVFQTVMAANYIEHLQKFILPEIRKGNNVVMTRYLPSMIAYGITFGIDKSLLVDITQAVYSQYSREIGVLNMEELYLKVSVETGITRINTRDKSTDQKVESLFENTDTLTKVSEVYNNHPFSCVFDGEKNISDINSDIVDYLKL